MDDTGVDGDGGRQAGKQHPFVRGVRIAAGGAKTAQGRDARADQHITFVAGPRAGSLPALPGENFSVILRDARQRVSGRDGRAGDLHFFNDLGLQPGAFTFNILDDGANLFQDFAAVLPGQQADVHYGAGGFGHDALIHAALEDGAGG